MANSLNQNTMSTSGGTKYVDVELPGVGIIPLLKLQQYLRDEGINHQKISDQAGGVSNISKMLNGRTPMPPAVGNAIKFLGSAAALRNLATSTSSAPKKKGRKTKPFGLSSFPVADVVGGFAADSRKALKEGVIGGSFSLRRCLTWARCFSMLQNLGMEEDMAFAGAFRLAVLNREESETQEYYAGLFEQKWAKLPAFVSPVKLKGVHPDVAMALPFMEAGIPVWLYGETGVGKTFNVRALAEHLKRPFHRFQCSPRSEVADIVGGLRAKKGETFFQHGPLPLAMLEGGILNVDEVSAPWDNSIQFALHAVLEGDDLSIPESGEPPISGTPGFSIVSCDNTRGLAEEAEYVGTRAVNEAFRDRFVFIEVGHMPVKQEVGVVEAALEEWA